MMGGWDGCVLQATAHHALCIYTYTASEWTSCAAARRLGSRPTTCSTWRTLPFVSGDLSQPDQTSAPACVGVVNRDREKKQQNMYITCISQVHAARHGQDPRTPHPRLAREVTTRRGGGLRVLGARPRFDLGRVNPLTDRGRRRLRS